MSQGAALFDRPASTPQPRHLLQFKAGKLTKKKDNWVHPDSRKGCAYLYQSADSQVHFCWFDRRTGLIEDNFVLVPKESEFKRVPQCKTGRVYVLKVKNERFFIWMQEPNVANDSEICYSVNKFIDLPIPPPSTVPMADLLGGIRGLSGLNQNDLLALLSMGVGLGSGLSSDTDASSAHAAPTSTGNHLNANRVVFPSLHTATASSVPVDRPPITASSAVEAGQRPSGLIRLQELHSILSSVNTGQSGERACKINLNDGINTDTVRQILKKEDIDRLIQHLPSRDPEDKNLTPTENIICNVQSAQFKSALESFSESFTSGELGPLISQFNLGEGAVNAAKTGDVLALATALEDSPNVADKDKPDTSSSELNSSNPAAIEGAPKPDDDIEKMDTS